MTAKAKVHTITVYLRPHTARGLRATIVTVHTRAAASAPVMQRLYRADLPPFLNGKGAQRVTLWEEAHHTQNMQWTHVLYMSRGMDPDAPVVISTLRPCGLVSHRPTFGPYTNYVIAHGCMEGMARVFGGTSVELPACGEVRRYYVRVAPLKPRTSTRS